MGTRSLGSLLSCTSGTSTLASRDGNYMREVALVSWYYVHGIKNSCKTGP